MLEQDAPAPVDGSPLLVVRLVDVDAEYLDAADVGYRFLKEKMWDAKNGGFYWEDDATGSYMDPLLCTMYGGVSLDFAYAYDADGDGGQVTSYIGYAFLGHPTDPTGEVAPAEVARRRR
ncbi:MAG: hypothetical protein P8Y25_13075, partial [Chromatiaceae bacterium]